MSKAFAFSAGDMFEFGGVAIVCVCVCVVCKKRGLCRTSWSGRDEAALCRLPNSCSENSARSQNPVQEKGRAAGYGEKELKEYATEGDRLLLPPLADPPRLHLFLSVLRADSRAGAPPRPTFYAANIFSTEVVTFLLASSFFFLYSPRPS